MNWDEYNFQPYPVGWVCPIRGRVMSPTTPFCPCNGEGRMTYTSTGTGDVDWMNKEYLKLLTFGEEDRIIEGERDD